MLTEAIYRAASSADMSRSCNILAVALASLVQGYEALKSTMINVLTSIIPMLPVEHIEPLYALQTKLMCEG